ncbi:MAG: hypothetical protein QM808_12540 [Steroidobacteraceae bacterium]
MQIRFNSLVALCVVQTLTLGSAMAQQAAPTPEQVAAAAAAMVVTDNTKYTTGVTVVNGQYVAGSSTPATVTGTAGNKSASNLRIVSTAKDFNGLIVKGANSTYTLSDSNIELSGNGSNDFVGLAAGAMADGGATLILKNVNIKTTGVISPAVVNTNGGTLKVYNSTLVSTGGPLPADYVPKIGAGMMTPPDGLSIGGTARATITLNKSESYFYNSKIFADGWGALSTDMSNDYLYLEANDCDIRVTGKGYGLYADWGGHVVINNSKLSSGVFGGIVAGAARMELNNVDSQSGRSAVMLHSVMGKVTDIGLLTLHGGTHTADDAVILVRSANADITIDQAKLVSKKGVLLQAVVNPDSFATKVTGRAPGIRALVRDARLSGDILNEDNQRRMAVTLNGSTLKGAIRGVSIAIDKSSKWTATANSSVVLTNNEDVARISAASGVTVTVVPAEGSTLSNRKLSGGGSLVVSSAL